LSWGSSSFGRVIRFLIGVVVVAVFFRGMGKGWDIAAFADAFGWIFRFKAAVFAGISAFLLVEAA
jgi:hypothetical protein